MVITSLLDTDLYKFSMMQAVLHQFPGSMVEYRFKCRNANRDLRPYAEEIRQEIQGYCELVFSEEELDYLSNFSFFKADFIQFLRIFRLNPDYIEVVAEDNFDIIIKGPWLHTILFEVPVLAIISEVYTRNKYPNFDLSPAKTILAEKLQLVEASVQDSRFKFADYGTRRRFSKAWQFQVDELLRDKLPTHFAGTSNVLSAKQLNIKAMGTMAHEYLQACQSLGPRLIYSQRFAFEKWAQEYRGELGIALSDVYGIDAFLNDFDLYFCKLFDGARHDSGDPIRWGNKLLEHYQTMRVDPRTKTLVFSDALTFPKAIEIFHHFKEKVNIAFGIGTNLTNDCGVEPLQIVIKMVECNGQPVAKVSDEPGKTMCRDPSYLAYLKEVFGLDADST